MSQMTLLTGPERRRRWPPDERSRILAAAFAPGAIIADISRRYEVATSLIYKWRRQALATESGAAFAPAVLADEPTHRTSLASETAAIDVELASGARVSISASAPAALVTAVLRALQ
jgi:transposase